MFQLRCSVRNCQHLLRPHGGGLRCEAGHNFDRAKEGYWSLLQPQDRKSLKAGDCDDAVLARQRWLQRGYAKGLITALEPWTTIGPTSEFATKSSPRRVLDLGCGEGTFGPALFAEAGNDYCGIDLSKRAVRLAARSWTNGTWVLANADRTLPITDSSIDLIASLFGRRPASEIRRVLAPEGRCVIAVPAEEDLIELREQTQETGIRRSRWEAIADELTAVGLKHIEHRQWREQVDLQSDAILDALAMTYRAVRHSQRARIEDVTSMRVTLAADLLLFGNT